jgi:Spy/CpxP family protein refolding chaperone
MQGQMMAHVEHMLDEIGATADQKSRIKTILRGAMEPIAHSDMAAHHKAALAILTAPTIDRGTIEEMRAEHVAQIDAESRKLATAIADAAEVLTPDQRVKLAMMAQREHMTARVQ